MAEEKWIIKKRIQEGDKVFMPGDEYDGVERKKLGPNHPWVKANWVALEKPAKEEPEEKAPEEAPEEKAPPAASAKGKGK